MPWYKELHWRIILGLFLGLIYGVLAAQMGWVEFTQDWISPWGEIFMRLLKLIAVPLVLASLITGVASLSDIQKLSRIGGKTIGIYIGTTAVAVTIGLLVVNLIQPGKSVPAELAERLQQRDVLVVRIQRHEGRGRLAFVGQLAVRRVIDDQDAVPGLGAVAHNQVVDDALAVG